MDKALGPQSLDFLGGPGRTRTCNQTVMSGETVMKFDEKRRFP